MADLVVGAEQVLKLRFVDRRYNAATGQVTRPAIDLTNATAILAILLHPDGTTASKTMTKDADPTTGYATYRFQTADLQAGELKVQGKFTDGAGYINYSAEFLYFDVVSPIA